MLAYLKARVTDLWQGEEGPTAVEYAVMMALIIIVCVTAIATIGTKTNTTFTTVGSQLGRTGS
jgi:pilus assembly protein Flp/PilA